MDGSRGEREPVDSHTADTGRRGIRESPRLDSDSEIILNLRRRFDKDEYSASSLIHEISLASTESYSITAKTLEKAKNYLKDNADNVKKLKELLVNQALLLKDKTNNQLIQESFKGSKLYDYDLSKYQHTDNDVNKVINNIVYTLKYINNIYLIVLNNESDTTAFKSLYEDDIYKLKANLDKLQVEKGLPETPVLAPSTAKPNAREEKQTEIEIVSDDRLQMYNNVKNKLQEFIRIYNYLVSNINYQLKEQTGEKIEQLQYKKNLALVIAPAFGKDRRWWDNWDNETVKGKITTKMHNNLVAINENINSLNDKKKKSDETYINEQLTKLVSSINAAINVIDIGVKKYDIAKDELKIAKQQKDVKEAADKKNFDLELRNAAMGGNPPTKYKSTGITVYILYEKKKYKRTVYTKDNRKTKYCKINNKYILLSKLNVVE